MSIKILYYSGERKGQPPFRHGADPLRLAGIIQ
jgi:hypothetical protein